MNQSRIHRLLSLSLALAMTASLPAFHPVHASAAGTEQAKQQGQTSRTYEPWKHGYRLVDVLNWSPETDPYAAELRARVPLQERNDAFAATQANPNLKSEALVYNVAMGNYRSTDTAEAPWNGGQYYDDFSYNLFKFWQYTDFIGAGGRPTSGFDSVTAKEQERYEYGVIGIPIAAFTNTAHKNGVKAIAEYFIPRNPQYTEEWLYKDENGEFPYAKKMVEIARYYGFDGYFLNQEGDFDASLIPLYKEIIQYLRSEGLYIQWYDSIADDGTVRYLNEFADYDFAQKVYPNRIGNADWIQDPAMGRIADSIWLNYWWNQNTIDKSVALAKKLGVDPFETVFLGIECGYGKFEGGDLQMSSNRGEEINTSNSTVGYLDWVLDSTGNPKMSLSLWGGDFTHEQYGKVDNLRYTDSFQWSSEERERMWYTSATENAGDYTMEGVDRADVEVGKIVWPGLSKYVAERSAINGSVFTSNFNTGHGMQYWLNGKVSRNLEWSNMNLQDYLPTWQWWVETSGTPLTLDWDYGSKQEKRLVDGSMGKFDYTQMGAYNGGSSLVMYGSLKANKAQTIHLYKTELSVNSDSKLSLTYNKSSADDSSKLALVVTFQQNPGSPVVLPLENSGKKTNGWTTAEVSLGNYAGRTIAAIGVQVTSHSDVTGYQVNLGQLKLSDGKSHAPATPANFTVRKNIDTTGEIELAWTLNEAYDAVKLYNVYAVYADGSEKYVSGVYADSLYIQTLEDRQNVTGFHLRAVGPDGSESKSAYVALEKPLISNIRTVSQNGRLTVTWDEADSKFDNVTVTLAYWYSTRKNPSPVTVSKGKKTAELSIGTEDATRYILTLKTNGANSSTAYYFGELADHYSEPYDGDLRIHEDGETFSLTTPKAEDWYALHLTMDGETTTYYRHSGDNLYKIALPGGLRLASVVVEDMFGNMSQAVTYRFQTNAAAMTEKVPDKEIPDETLRKALFAKAGGNTYDALTKLTGKLDLSGLAIKDLTGIELMVNVSDLDISNTQVHNLAPLNTLVNLKTLSANNTNFASLTDGILPKNLVTLNLANNAKLSSVGSKAIANLTSLKTLNLSGNTALTTLYLDNSHDMKVNLSGTTGIATLVLDGTEMKTFDISAFTGLKQFSAEDSELATLSMADASVYASMTYLDISGSRFDLSANTPERALVNTLPEIAVFDSQRPEILYATLGDTVTISKGSGEVRLKTYFENIYKNATTVRGTNYTSIAGENWIAKEYNAKELCAVPSNVYVEIRDTSGKFINEPVQPAVLTDTDTNMAANAQVLGVTAENANETGAMLFDGSYSSKWCTGADSGWVAFATANPIEVGRWVTVHAQANNEAKEFNTVDYELQVLNTDAVGMTEAEFLASGSKSDTNVLGKDENWKTIAHITNNTEAIVDEELETAGSQATVYRLKVNVAYGDTPWGAIRFQEVELYNASNAVRDFEGNLNTANDGTYQVAFKKGLKNTLVTTNIVVK